MIVGGRRHNMSAAGRRRWSANISSSSSPPAAAAAAAVFPHPCRAQVQLFIAAFQLAINRKRSQSGAMPGGQVGERWAIDTDIFIITLMWHWRRGFDAMQCYCMVTRGVTFTVPISLHSHEVISIPSPVGSSDRSVNWTVWLVCNLLLSLFCIKQRYPPRAT